jgi:hypothetical protein
MLERSSAPGGHLRGILRAKAFSVERIDDDRGSERTVHDFLAFRFERCDQKTRGRQQDYSPSGQLSHGVDELAHGVQCAGRGVADPAILQVMTCSTNQFR